MGEARFIVGIDLGTTNTVVAQAPLGDLGGGTAARAPASPLAGGPVPTIVPLAQRETAGTVRSLPALRSALYAPTPGEVPVATDPPFPEEGGWVVGELAVRRGAEVPSRHVASAKSWLCHPGVDHREAILPWGTRGDEDETDRGPAMSPVEASRRLLAHVRSRWDAEHPDAPLSQQEVVLTVPASFDEVARELTAEAARAAGLEPRFLEEPQAAFYSWLQSAGEAGLTEVLGAGPAARVLVVDVGGGTTDLSLLEIARRSGDGERDDGDAAGGPEAVKVSRVAVGRHLLLGGDNMDLALAVRAEERLSPGARLDAGRFAQLVSQCRRAKEQLLGDAPPERVAIAIAPRGAALVGGALRTEITRAEADELVLTGFFPPVARDERPARARGGLVAFGLPYERDAAITRHVAEFVARHVPEGASVDALLLNGGVFRAAGLARRLVEVVASWQSSSPHVLTGTDPDRAVALGAVAYGMALAGRGRRIESRSARGYYLGLGSTEGAGSQVVCIVPRGAEEGRRFVARGRPFGLTLGRPARFDLWSSDVAHDQAGDVVGVDEERFTRSRPLGVRVGAPGEKGEIAVALEGELSALGTLDLAFVEAGGGDARPPRRFRLAFDLRQGDGEGATPLPSVARASIRPSDKRLEEGGAAIERVFGKAKGQGDERDAKNLLRELERVLGERAAWPPDLARQLVDRLLPLAKQRRRSAEHERAFYALLGFTLRPGFGVTGDDARVDTAFQLFREKLTFAKEMRGWQQYWIAWRRMAGGLVEPAQLAMRDELDRHLAPHDARSRKPKPPKAEAEGDLIELLSWLERVPAGRRAELGGWLLDRTWTDRDPRLWAALGRLGAREPAYASAHHAIPARVAERWIDHLLRENWGEVPTAARAAWSMSRVVGDRSRDLGEATRTEVVKRLTAIGADPRWILGVKELVAREEKERAELFGDDLPPGLRIL